MQLNAMYAVHLARKG